MDPLGGLGICSRNITNMLPRVLVFPLYSCYISIIFYGFPVRWGLGLGFGCLNCRSDPPWVYMIPWLD